MLIKKKKLCSLEKKEQTTEEAKEKVPDGKKKIKMKLGKEVRKKSE